VEAGLAERLSFQRSPRLVPARLGADAGVIGAGLVGWDGVHQQQVRMQQDQGVEERGVEER